MIHQLNFGSPLLSAQRAAAVGDLMSCVTRRDVVCNIYGADDNKTSQETTCTYNATLPEFNLS